MIQMTIQDNLKEFAPYNIDFKINNEWFVVGVEFSKKWQIIVPQNNLIEHIEKLDRHYYCAPLSDVEVDEVFDCIRETISYNKDMERKIELFQEKINELQDLFSVLDYDELCTIEFKTKKKKKKNKSEIQKTECDNDNVLKEEPILYDPLPIKEQEETNIEDFIDNNEQ